MLTHFGMFLCSLGGKEPFKTDAALWSVALRSAFSFQQNSTLLYFTLKVQVRNLWIVPASITIYKRCAHNPYSKYAWAGWSHPDIDASDPPLFWQQRFWLYHIRAIEVLPPIAPVSYSHFPVACECFSPLFFRYPHSIVNHLLHLFRNKSVDIIIWWCYGFLAPI